MRILISFFDRRRLKTLAKLPILFCAVGLPRRACFYGVECFNFKNVSKKIFGMIWFVVAADVAIFPSQSWTNVLRFRQNLANCQCNHGLDSDNAA